VQRRRRRDGPEHDDDDELHQHELDGHDGDDELDRVDFVDDDLEHDHDVARATRG
jgi:hypothetical protein